MVEGLSLTKTEGRRGLELGEGTEKRKRARIKALGNSTRVLSQQGGGAATEQQQDKRGPQSWEMSTNSSICL